MPASGKIGNKGGGRLPLRVEVSVYNSFLELTPKVFKVVQEALKGNKTDKRWAADWAKGGLVKMIPQIIGGDPDNPLFFMPSDLIVKNEITATTDKDSIPPSPEASSSRQAQVSDSKLRETMGQDNLGSLGNDSQSGEQAKPAGSLPSPDLSTGAGHSVDSFIESLPTSST